MVERRSGGIRVISSVSILGTFGGLALAKWLGSSGHQGEGIASLGIGSSTQTGGFLLLGIGLLLSVILIRAALWRVLEATRQQEVWLDATAGEWMDELSEESSQLQMELGAEREERYWQFEPMEWVVENPVGEEGVV